MQLFIVPIYQWNVLNNLYSTGHSHFKNVSNKNCCDFYYTRLTKNYPFSILEQLTYALPITISIMEMKQANC